MEGIRAATTPMGTATSIRCFALSSLMIPTVFISLIAFQVRVLPSMFLSILSCQIPKPVSSLAIFARRSAFLAPASAMASQILSIFSWLNSASSAWAALAFATRSLTSCIDCKSLSICIPLLNSVSVSRQLHILHLQMPDRLPCRLPGHRSKVHLQSWSL